MHLYDLPLIDLPLIFALVGLALYAVVAGADFGAGFWQLTAGRRRAGERIRDHAHESMAAVWEANHVWLIFVITVVWTAYPAAFGSIASTLSFALFIATVGIIFRGATYALRAGASDGHEQRAIDTLFGISSALTPFALGAAVGGIASRRVAVGNAAGNLFSSWLNPTSIFVGLLAVASGAYLAAVYLSRMPVGSETTSSSGASAPARSAPGSSREQWRWPGWSSSTMTHIRCTTVS